MTAHTALRTAVDDTTADAAVAGEAITGEAITGEAITGAAGADSPGPAAATAATVTRLGRPRDGAREDAILVATLQVLAETGYDRLTVEAVAARAKASKATIYRRFSGKAELVAAAVQCRPVAVPVTADTGELRTDLVAHIEHFVADLAAQDLDLIAGMTSAMRGNPDLAALLREQMIACRREAGTAWLLRAVERGAIRPSVDLDLIAEIVPSVVFQRLLVTGEPVDRSFVERLVDRVLLPLLIGDAADGQLESSEYLEGTS